MEQNSCSSSVMEALPYIRGDTLAALRTTASIMSSRPRSVRHCYREQRLKRLGGPHSCRSRSTQCQEPRSPPLQATAIWLRPPPSAEPPALLPIKEIVPPSFAIHVRVREIADLEQEARAHEESGNLVEAAEAWEAAIESRRCFLSDAHEGTCHAVVSFIMRCNFWSQQQCSSWDGSPMVLELFQKAETIFEETNTVQGFTQRHELRAQTLLLMATFFKARGKTEAALQAMARAARLASRLKDIMQRAIIETNYAVLLSTVGRHKEALAIGSQAVSVIMEGSDRRMLALDKRLQEEGADAAAALREDQEDLAYVLVVARHNMWIEHYHCGTVREGGWCIQRALQIALLQLGEDHPLTTKVSAAAAAHIASLPSPKAIAADDAREPELDVDVLESVSLVADHRPPSSAVGDGRGLWESEQAMQQLAERQVITRRFIKSSEAPFSMQQSHRPRLPPTTPPKNSRQQTELSCQANNTKQRTASKTTEFVYGLRTHTLPDWALSPRKPQKADSILRPWVVTDRGG